MSKESKYDTNPLDQGFVRETDEIFAATREIGSSPKPAGLDEEPTRRFQEPSASYPSVFAPPVYQPPPQHTPFTTLNQGPPIPPPAKLANRRLPKLNLPENVAAGLAYVPFFLGMIVSLAELFLLPRSEVRARFHAAQALGLHFIVLLVGAVFKGAHMLAALALGNFSLGMLGFFSGLFSFAALVFFIVSMVRVLRGQDVRYAPVADITKWINQHLEPMK